MVVTDYYNGTSCSSGNFIHGEHDTSGLTPSWIIIDDQVFAVSSGSNYGSVKAELKFERRTWKPTRRQFYQPPYYALILRRLARNAVTTKARSLSNLPRLPGNAKTISIKSSYISKKQKRRDYLMRQAK